MSANARSFPFRPWVRRAGLSILLVATGVTVAIVAALILLPKARYGWLGERFVWVYVGTLWLGGAKVFAGTLRPIAEVDDAPVPLRALLQSASRTIEWTRLLGTEQMIGGDRLIVYFDSSRGMRFVALNLNLVKGRRDFLALLDARLLVL